MKRIVILISGRGSNMQAVLEAKLNAAIAAVISNNPTAKGLQIAHDAGVDTKGAQTRIVVETNGPKGVQTVMVDAQSGQVVSTHAGGETD